LILQQRPNLHQEVLRMMVSIYDSVDHIFFTFHVLLYGPRVRNSLPALLRTVRATTGDRAFPAAAASVWNSLPETVRSSPSLPVFCSRLKTNFLLGLTADLTNKRLTTLTTT